ncbi:complex I intermediate-associated protein 30, mitochondrial [Pseudomyrmex gracilis]|uniref:complex I intermediate-associated protein 30, mitochondrial n=1 Tax=Pseudomyrmex gracilis TaxID=219809 RepID=UPI000994B1C6|nr:complex I intermediate-associated protein 30, mitochondrial [Pseudomyrmex gracilis]
MVHLRNYKDGLMLKAHFTIDKRQLHTTANLSCFYVRDRKYGYKKYDKPPPEPEKLSVFGQMREGWRKLKEEFGLWIEEMKENYQTDPSLIYRRGEVDVVWRFKDDPKSLDQWIVTCDSDYNEGYSTAKLEMSSIGTGVFSGVLSNRLPKDGRLAYAGYCNITTIPKYKSFNREAAYDWSPGGPYWQYVKMPFSKFVFVSRGRIQDNQYSIMLNDVKNLGITLADDVSGHFRLEIDYIGLEHDIYEYEENAYETYDFKGVRF